MSQHAFHGGASFEAIGVKFDSLDERSRIIDADVLDAWYDPAPGVLASLREHLAWLVKTSPPTHAQGLREVLAEARGLDPSQILLGGGTSFLMFLALPRLLPPRPLVLALDPSYGEYAHLVEEVLEGEISRLPLDPEADFDPDIDQLIGMAREVDMVVLVNPNSPTGRVISQGDMIRLAESLRPDQKLWIDETYIDFVPGVPTLEPLLKDHPNVIIAKSLSKHYALSGLRIGSLEMAPHLVSFLEKYSPPWSVGLPAQLAGVEALRDPTWYEAKVAETRVLRQRLSDQLSQIRACRVIHSETNFLMLHFPKGGADALVERSMDNGIFVRSCDSLTHHLKGQLVRVAIKSGEQNDRIAAVLTEASAVMP